MPDSPVKYRAIPLSEGEADHHTRQAEAQTKWTYFLLGCAILLPWNALINATSFFLSRMAGSGFYPTFSSYMSTAYYDTYNFMLLQSSPSRRIFVTIIVMILLVTSLCFSTFIRGTPLSFLSFALFSAATLAAASGYQCTAVYAGAALLGAPYLQTVISGQAAVAVAVSVVQVVSTLISLWGSSPEPGSMKVTMANAGDDQAEEIAARIFFGVSTIFLCIILAAYAWLTRQPFYKSVISTLEPHYETGDIDERTGLVEDDRRNSPTDKNVTFMFSIAYVFAAVYPAITVRVRSVNLGIHPMLFTAIHFLVFNVGDLVGRYACSFPRLIVWSAKKILVMSLLRTLFVPLFLLCNVQQSTTTIPISPIISSDTLFMAILLAMGYTNGYVSSIALLAVSSLEHNPRLNGRREDVDVAATLGGSFVIVGLASGALSSFGVQSMI
ncbi:nucleoside transporter-domain-containing protein [Boletus edulis]|nr:nucleoside transporter-domain-containing protein [Boletus edulis]